MGVVCKPFFHCQTYQMGEREAPRAPLLHLIVRDSWAFYHPALVWNSPYLTTLESSPVLVYFLVVRFRLPVLCACLWGVATRRDEMTYLICVCLSKFKTLEYVQVFRKHSWYTHIILVLTRTLGIDYDLWYRYWIIVLTWTHGIYMDSWYWQGLLV